MKILVACEFSGIVRDAFRAKGHDAISCDILSTESVGPHYQGDVRDILYQEWDMILAFPPCTHLASSGARWFKEKQKDGRQQKGIEFFRLFTDLDCPRVMIENPVGIMSTRYRKPDQIIQPWQFGHAESKKTCLWLKGLPFLKPTNIIPLPELGYWANQTPTGQNKLGPSPERAKNRSKTYSGIAQAMADRWGV